MWSGDMKLVKINKLNIEVPNKPDWNSLIEAELVSRLDVKAPIGDKDKERQEKQRKERERKGKDRKERDRKEKERKKIEKRNKKKKKSKK